MELLKLIGILVVIVGFVLKFDTMATKGFAMSNTSFLFWEKSNQYIMA